MFPLCSLNDNHIHCARGVILGILSLLTFFAGLYCIGRILHFYSKTRSFFAVNATMIGLATTQVFFSTIKYLFVNDERLQISAAFIRSLGTTLACLIWGHVVLESYSKTHLIKKYLFPAAFVFVIYLVIIYIITLFFTWIPCHHPAWLLMSVSQLFLSLIFFILGLISNFVINMVSKSQNFTDNHGLVFASKNSLHQKQRELWMLMIVVTCCSIIQVALDSWLLSMHVDGGSCELLDTQTDELIRTLLATFTFLVPVWSTLYIFYYLNRSSFDSTLDIQFDLSPNGTNFEDKLIPPSEIELEEAVFQKPSYTEELLTKEDNMSVSTLQNASGYELS